MYLVKRLADTDNIEVLANTEVGELVGEDRLDGILAEDNRSGALRKLGARALFVYIGADANTAWLRGAVKLDDRGFVLTGEALSRSMPENGAWQGRVREPFYLETSMPGVSLSATFAVDRSNGSLPRWAKAPWR